MGLRRICPKCMAALQGRVCRCGFVAEPNSDYAMALPNYILLNNRYILLGVIGAGGFGVTYRALDLTTKQVCAMKEYVPAGVAIRRPDGLLCADSGAKNGIYQHGKFRFMEEAYMLQKLNYMPSTATIRDCFEENNTAYYVMDFIQGRTIKEILVRQGRMDLAPALNVLCSVAEALDQIHRTAHIIHRDISPENIMLTSNGEVKLLDFGSAKFEAKRAHENFTVVLKSGYAPPEQYTSDADKQGPHTDVYALVSTFYYMVTGIKIPSAMARCNGATYTPLAEIMGAPRELSDAVDRGLQLSRQMRTGTCRQLLEELSVPIYQLPKSPEPIPPTDIRARVENRQRQVLASQQKQPRQPVSGSVRREQSGTATGAWIAIQIDKTSRTVSTLSLRPNRIYRLGRDRNADIVVPVQLISKTHCYLYFDAKSGAFAVKDVSRNGTKLGNRPLPKGRFCTIPAGSALNLSENACWIHLRKS